MTREPGVHDALADRRASAPEDKRDLVDRRSTQIERHHPGLPLLARKARRARNVSSRGSSDARYDSPCGEGAHPNDLVEGDDRRDGATRRHRTEQLPYAKQTRRPEAR